MKKTLLGLVRSKENVCLSIIILFLFFQIVPLAVRNASATTMPRIAAGGLHSIAMKTTGTVWTWGNNMYGQLGDGTATDSNIPVYVSGFSDAISVAGGFWHTVALKSDGTVWTWGNNTYGQLGNGTISDSSLPVPVSGISDIVAIASGYWHTVALKNDGTVWTWGNNFYGQLGNGTYTDAKTPVQVSGLSNVIAIASGYWHTIALKSDGTVWTWGNNTYGQLGNGTNIHSATPVQVSNLTDVDTNVDNVTSIAGGYWHSLALKTDGTAWAWGNNYYGQLGDGSNTDSNVPGQMKLNPPTVRTVSATDVMSDSATLNGTVDPNGLETTVWFGYGTTIGSYDGTTSSQIVNGRSTTSVAIGVSGLTNNKVYYFRIVAESIAGISYGNVVSFTTPAALGIAESTDNAVTTKSGYIIRNLLAVAGGGGHTLCLRSDGSVWTCGSNHDGQLGNERYEDSNGLGIVSGLGGIITSIAGGNWHTTALRSDGTIWTWGANYNGQLGDGTNYNSNSPVQVKNFDIKLEKGKIHGYVADMSGGTLDSVQLKCTAKKGIDSQSTQSDSNGYFEFKGLTENTYYISARRKGYRQVKSTVVLQADEIKEIKIDMKLKSKPKTVSSTPSMAW